MQSVKLFPKVIGILTNPTEDNSREWTIPFQEGVLLIFRSEVPHCVPKNINSERISIAINYK